MALVRRRLAHWDLAAIGAELVVETSIEQDIAAVISKFTGDKGLSGIVDRVGGGVTGDLIRTLGWGGHAVLYGGFSPDKFQLHNFDVLMNGVVVKAYAYRYFFTPPATPRRCA